MQQQKLQKEAFEQTYRDATQRQLEVWTEEPGTNRRTTKRSAN